MALKVTQIELLDRLSLHDVWFRESRNSREPRQDKLSIVDAEFSDIDMSDKNFAAAELVRCVFTNARFKNCDFSYSILIRSRFKGCTFLSCSFVKAELKSADLSSSNLSGSDFTRADLTGANLNHSNLTNCTFNWAWLVDADLRYAVLDHVEFEGTRVVKAKVGNLRRFVFGSLHRATIKDVDVSVEGDGRKLASGMDALDFLKRK
jgi:uncharacterized protein YjbI with pentapeptide repeats